LAKQTGRSLLFRTRNTNPLDCLSRGI